MTGDVHNEATPETALEARSARKGERYTCPGCGDVLAKGVLLAVWICVRCAHGFTSYYLDALPSPAPEGR